MTDFNATRSQFDLPEGLIYLDGNSLGPVPRDAAGAVARVVTDEWGELLVRGWNDADWMESSTRIGDRIGRLIGAPEGTVIVGDTLSLKVYQALAAALERNLLRGEETASEGLIDFVFGLERRIAALEDDLLLSGRLTR